MFFKYVFPKGNSSSNFQPSIFRCEMLVSGRVYIYIYSIRRVSNHPDLVSVACWGIQGHFSYRTDQAAVQVHPSIQDHFAEKAPERFFFFFFFFFFFGFVVKTPKKSVKSWGLQTPLG